MRVRVTVTVSVVVATGAARGHEGAVGVVIGLNVNTVAFTGGGTTVDTTGHTVIETVLLTHVLHGGQLTRLQGIVNGRTTTTVLPPVDAGMVTDEHP